MSDLHRSAISARLAKLPQLPTSYPMEGEEDGDGENDSIGELPNIRPPGSSFAKPKQRQKKTPNPDYAPISAVGYFKQAVEVSVPDVNLNFRVYYTPPRTTDGTVMVCHHGAGYSGLSFACFAKEVVRLTNGECGVLALDARRHGKTTSTTSDEDLSVEVLSKDLIGLVCTIFPDPLSSPTFLLVGHSMGGSVIVRTCPGLLEAKYKVTGVVVLDVVEGSALEALPHMHNLLNSRPDGFDSPEEAIEWHVSTHTIRNPISARISVPSLIVPAESKDELAPAYKWRIPLRSTAPYWENWFLGLSKNFLAARTARLLVLAGTDRLDKELMIGQMQGKFQMNVVPDTGHMLHEDNPDRLADILTEFWRRNERVIIGIKKVGEL
ncbi:protein phosphatase methylesterase [Rickenella mellea]|uniref:Protein phosphatase methylesterase 1 n=1 Tax=Rickenella mellea TaxID=50990 RepID=A0A4Y7QES2_9AGAM|nr:protein phosphatase methylesterase [Rickenella mellea]